MPLQARYMVNIARDADSDKYHAVCFSLVDKKESVLHASKLGALMQNVSRLLRKKDREINLFPMPKEESRIIVPLEGGFPTNGR